MSVARPPFMNAYTVAIADHSVETDRRRTRWLPKLIRLGMQRHRYSWVYTSVRSFGGEETQDLLVTLVSTLQALPPAQFLRSRNGSKALFHDLLRLNAAVSSADFDVKRIPCPCTQRSESTNDQGTTFVVYFNA
ncbi:hypothetical protein BU25DRAFT_410649 [Macroventuria anomochaeta]|uniref:Uncharacterized protein n=1 Tax=Macroventuria anomochaeta TaxID=301207 RepID=A0ACB6RZU2_9PLEO|nr:uncharacterized protein BU25DRAFT_410649 [Macroventuria anomochaeta]KAF2627495.1 hypothetical protein BU25DRAFT_410649 [Macroventuria anomochaeta]